MKIGVFEYNWGKAPGGSQLYLGAAAASLAREHDVTILHQYDDQSNESIAQFLDLDLSGVSFRRIPRLDVPSGETPRGPLARHRYAVAEHAEISRPFDLFLANFSFQLPAFNHSPLGILVVDFPYQGYDWWHDFGQPSPRWTSPAGAARRVYRRYLWRERFASYRRVVTYSDYSRSWLRRRWLVDSTVIYPPCRDGMTPAAKEAMILGVGRFVPDKKADVLVEAFRSLCDRGLRGWRLVLAGGRAKDWEGAEAYIDQLTRRAEGYPIDLLFDVPGPELRRLFEAASIFWHAKGYGVDPEAHPEHMEHFGIVTVEAMSAGCVPVVIAAGGQPEIIADGVDGYLWRDLDELADRTRALVADPERLRVMARSAARRAASFNKEAFVARFREAVVDLLGS